MRVRGQDREPIWELAGGVICPRHCEPVGERGRVGETLREIGRERASRPGEDGWGDFWDI